MNKKFIKLFAASALAFFVSTTLVNAKTYTSLEDLTKDVETWKENETGEEDTVGYIFIIGEHVFTSNYVESINDLISYATAWQTIPTSSKPYIIEIDKYSDGWNLETQTNLFNNGVTLPETLNIQYVDMERFGDKVATNYDVNTFVDVANTHVNNTENTEIYGKYELNFDETTGKVTFTAIDPNLTIASIKNSGIIAELSRILATGNYTEIKITDLADSTKTASLNANATTETIANSVRTLINGATKLADLTNKKFKVELVLEEGKIPEDGNLSEFELDFVSMINTDEFLINQSGKSNGGSYAFSCSKSETDHCVPVINILNSSKNYSGVQKLTDALQEALKDNRISSIYFEIGDSNAEFKGNATVDVNPLIKSAMGTSETDLKYSNLASLKKATIRFTLADSVKSVYENDSNIIEYTVYIGEYVDTDSIVDAIAYSMNHSNVGSTDVTDANQYYHLDRIDDKLTLDAKIANDGKFYKFKRVTDGLAKIIYGSEDYSVINSKSNTSIKDILIIDNTTEKQYILMTTTSESEQVLTLAKILGNILGVDSIASDYVTPSALQNLDISIKFVINDTNELMPGMVATDSEAKSATYDITFNVDDFKFNDMMSQMFNTDSDYFTSVDPTAEENVYNIELDLNSVGSSLEDAKLFDKLEWYAGLFSTIKVTVEDQTETLNLTDLSAAKTSIASILGISDSDDVSALNGKEITFEFTVADDVNNYTVETANWTSNAEKKSETYTVNVEFTCKEANVGERDSIENALQTEELDVINLAKGAQYSGNLTISDSNANIEINGNGATITGKVTIDTSADNIVINNLNISGDLVVKGNNLVINGTKTGDKFENTIKGSINVEGSSNVTIDSMNVQGTKENLITSGGKKSVIEASAGNGTLTLTNSKISYINDGQSVGSSDTVYSLLHLDGNAVITGNEFDINGVKNPIEYKFATSSATEVVISDNEFKGDNYLASDAHNVISFYGSSSNSTITIDNNKFEYANWAVRISDLGTSADVTYIVTNNIVKNITVDGHVERNDKAFMGIQTLTGHTDLSHITIKQANNKIAEISYLVDKVYKHSEIETVKGTPLVVTRNGEGSEGSDVSATGITLEAYTTETNE